MPVSEPDRVIMVNVDKNVVKAQVQGAMDTGKLQLELYARNLEQELEKVTAQLEFVAEGPKPVDSPE